jgi:nucleotide-binding universal stress UspA family protein
MKRPRRRIYNIDKGKLTPFGSRVLSRIPARKLDIVAQPSEAETRRYLSEKAATLTKEGLNVEAIVVSGKPHEQVVDFARRNSVDLIVMASHGRSGVSRRPYGSVAEGIIRASSVPILLVVPPAVSQLVCLTVVFLFSLSLFNLVGVIST